MTTKNVFVLLSKVFDPLCFIFIWIFINLTRIRQPLAIIYNQLPKSINIFGRINEMWKHLFLVHICFGSAFSLNWKPNLNCNDIYLQLLLSCWVCVEVYIRLPIHSFKGLSKWFESVNNEYFTTALSDVHSKRRRKTSIEQTSFMKTQKMQS